MKRMLAIAMFALVATSAVAAAANDHTTPPPPGSKGCVGQTVAYLAQASKNGIFPEAFRGIGGVSRGSGLTNKEIMDIVQQYCSQ